jgi:hypothetical protein
VSLTNIGFSGLHLVDSSYDWDPQNGVSRTDIWEGEENACNAEAAALETVGIRSRVYRHEGVEFRLQVFYPDANDGAQPFVDTWERQTEWAQLDIRNSPKLLAEIGALIGGPGEELIGTWHHQIKKLLSEEKNVPASDPTLKKEMYRLYARGTEVYEVKRFVLRRRRTFSPQYAGRAVLDAVEKVYTTQKLIELFGIPQIIQMQLPQTPPTKPSESVWAWRSRVDNSTTQLGRVAKTEEVLDWVFAAWSTLLYDVVA